MKKIILAFLILFSINTFSQTKKKKSKSTAKTEELTITEKEPVIIKVTSNSDDVGMLTISENDAVPGTDEGEENNTIYNAAGIEVQPEFPGGNDKAHVFIKKNFNIPTALKNQGQKKIFAMFVVEKDGSLNNIKLLRGGEEEFNKEAIRILKLMPKWLPAEQNGKHVRCSFTLPITIDTN